MGLTIVACRQLIFDKLWLCSLPEWVIGLIGEFAFELRNIVGIFFSGSMLRERRFEIGAIHFYIANNMDIWTIEMVLLLDGFDLRMRVDWSAGDAGRVFIKGFTHLLHGWLLLVIGILGFHDWGLFLLNKGRYTIPSSRTILLAVSHLVLLSSLGSALWNPFPSRQVIP